MEEVKKGVCGTKTGNFLGRGMYSQAFHPLPELCVKDYEFPSHTDEEALELQKNAILEFAEVMDALMNIPPHPNVCPYKGFELVKGAAGGTNHARLTVGYIDSIGSSTPKGVSKTLLESREIKGEFAAKKIAPGLVAGIAHLHKNGVTHDDVRPHNVYLTKSGAVVVTDYAIFKTIMTLKEPAAGEATTRQVPNYLAPEALSQGCSYDPFKMDVWGIGCVVLEVMTGKPPYTELDPNNKGRLMMQIMKSPAPPSYAAAGAISAELKSFLDACFERDFEKRATAEELLTHPWLVKAAAENSA